MNKCIEAHDVIKLALDKAAKCSNTDVVKESVCVAKTFIEVVNNVSCVTGESLGGLGNTICLEGSVAGLPYVMCYELSMYKHDDKYTCSLCIALQHKIPILEDVKPELDELNETTDRNEQVKLLDAIATYYGSKASELRFLRKVMEYKMGGCRSAYEEGLCRVHGGKYTLHTRLYFCINIM